MAKFSNPFKSLWGQTLFGTLALVLLGQVVTLALVFVFIISPQTGAFGRIAGENLANSIFLLQETPGKQRNQLLALVRRSADIEMRATPPANAKRSVPRLQKRFLTSLASSLRERGATAILFGDRGRTLWVQIVLDGKPVWLSISPHAARPVELVAIGLLLVPLALAGFAAFMMSSFIMAPLKRMRNAADRVHKSNTLARMVEGGPAELAALSRSFNDMVRRIEEADNDRNLILAGISHDLRTPLARLRIAFEMSGMAQLPHGDLAERQIERIQTILSQFMRFARGFEAEPISVIDLAVLARGVVMDYSDRGVILSVAPNLSQLAVRPEALRRSLFNLIENALKYGNTPVEVDIMETTASVNLIVRDRGKGLTEDETARLRRPFVRGVQSDEATSLGISVPGTGLGLAIVDKIAQLHGGTLEFGRANGMFEARLVLPKTDTTNFPRSPSSRSRLNPGTVPDFVRGSADSARETLITEPDARL